MKKIIFFIENESHIRFVEKLLLYFLENNFPVFLICQKIPFDNKNFNFKNLEIKVLKNDFDKINTLKRLEGSIFFTTTPSIGTAIFPKSIVSIDLRPIYVYLFHSLVSPNQMYVKNSFKYFDYIFSPSEIVTDQINYLVSKTTKVFTTGYLLFDGIEPFSRNNLLNDKILLAPTWGQEGLKKIYRNIDKIKNFSENLNLELIFRPHPMVDLKDIKLTNIQLDTSRDLNNLFEYNHLITDYSGIALEYFYLTARATLFLDVPKKIKRNLKSREKHLVLIENDMRNKIGLSKDFESLKYTDKFPNLDNALSKVYVKKINSFVESKEKILSILEQESLLQ
jgi:hypothetical protein